MYSIVENPSAKYTGWKLSYVDEIPPEVWKATPETEAYQETDEYKRNLELYGYSWHDPKVEYRNYPNPEYIPGMREMYAYFSPVSEIGEVIGDDHDDVPYEHNAGIPYDTVGNNDVEVLMIPFSLPLSSFWRGSCEVTLKEPKDYGNGNSPFSAEDINLGAVPWIFVRTCKYKYGNVGIPIMAGISPGDFLEKVREVKNLVESFLGDSDFTVLGKSEDLWIIRNNRTYAIQGFTEEGEQRALSWSTGYYGDRFQIFETYEEDYEGTITPCEDFPKGLISKIKNKYL